MTNLEKIKHLLVRSELAQKKVTFNHNGTKVNNPMQQGAANRLYTKAYKLASELGLDTKKFIEIHRQVIDNEKPIFN